MGSTLCVIFACGVSYRMFLLVVVLVYLNLVHSMVGMNMVFWLNYWVKQWMLMRAWCLHARLNGIDMQVI